MYPQISQQFISQKIDTKRCSHHAQYSITLNFFWLVQYQSVVPTKQKTCQCPTSVSNFPSSRLLHTSGNSKAFSAKRSESVAKTQMTSPQGGMIGSWFYCSTLLFPHTSKMCWMILLLKTHIKRNTPIEVFFFGSIPAMKSIELLILVIVMVWNLYRTYRSYLLIFQGLYIMNGIGYLIKVLVFME